MFDFKEGLPNGKRPDLPPVLAKIEARQHGVWDLSGDVFLPAMHKGDAATYKHMHADYEQAFYYSSQFPTRYAEGYISESASVPEFKLRAHNFRKYLRDNEASCGDLYTQPQHLEKSEPGRRYA